jgi:hypothetical protein
MRPPGNTFGHAPSFHAPSFQAPGFRAPPFQRGGWHR